MQRQILIIGGPTAVGKTALSVRLAQALKGEIVNADAYQIYRGMDIGTAKATLAERGGVPHHLLDIVTPGTPYTVAQFKQQAMAVIAEIQQRGHLPIVVGGTGFYLNALRLGLPLGGEAPPSAYRKTLQKELVSNGPDWLWQRLQAQDPKAASQIPVGNSRRVIRALEVIALTGRRFSQQPAPKPVYDALILGLTTDRAQLYRRINARVEAMVQGGLVAEVKRVVAQAGPQAQALKAIGYKELLPYFAGEASLETCIALVQQHSRQYAKRQLTYFRHQMPTQWFDLIAQPQQYQDILNRVTQWYNKGVL
ncbi:tRNA (adenosine(37)-N6)-dimethylallyltransferase MiaA [Lacticaseibacillus baoqingensis]|uniref:tRNA dimethylallyltransferase n=1 Tax=Lacticaseibacillus baoqingensis TaxID=2486013 RepID=A0ABW4E319_9LACO|nr:tRNA (adenosine(37)-N6)-dimethylallyltransferase MiaA [Lacticaseibacillus baoqingensis]